MQPSPRLCGGELLRIEAQMQDHFIWQITFLNFHKLVCEMERKKIHATFHNVFNFFRLFFV